MPLRSAASPLALRMIREAFEDLERAVIPADAKDFGSTTLQNVQKAALEIENRMGAQFQNVLAVYYCDILKFHKAAYNFVRRRSWSLFFHVSFGRFGSHFDNIISNLKSHERLLDQTANAINISEAREARMHLEQQRKDRIDKTERDEKHKTAEQYDEIVAWLKADPSEQDLILKGVMEKALKFSSGCDWILKVDRIKAWMQRSTDEPFVWLQGKPGSGKSVLAGHIIGFLQNVTRSDHSILVSHFCTYSYASSTKYDSILRSLLLQILRANDDLVAYVFNLKRTEFSMRVPTSKSLEKLIQTVASAVPQTPGEAKYIHLVLDGLDECEPEKQGQLISLLGQLVAARSGSPHPAIYKILLLSRNSSFLTKRLRKIATVVSLTEEAHHLEKAIRSYAYSKLSALRSRLMSMGVGMYLWARLVIEYISENMFYNKDEIFRAAQELPTELGAFYERILVQILGNFDMRSTERLKSIFGWIAYAKRPLRMFEFQSALAFGLGDPMVTDVPPAYLFGMCAPLIEERKDSTFAFIRVSVKDYLKSRGESTMISKDTASYEHGTASVTCLLSGLTVFNTTYPAHDQSLRVLRGLHALHVYAKEFWLDHVLEAMASNQMHSPCRLRTLMSQLASKLFELDITSTQRHQVRDGTTSDSTLECLKPFEGLYIYAKIVLQARSAKSLEEKASQSQGNSDGQVIPQDVLSTTLSLYQSIVESLLSARSFPGTSMEDLDRFKKSHKTPAFTCHLNGCARSTTGFENDRLRKEHEKSHVSRLYCDHPGCEYPPFSSARALKSHMAKWHEQAQQQKPKRSIRPPKTLRDVPAPGPSSQRPQDSQREVASASPPADFWYNLTTPMMIRGDDKESYIARDDQDFVLFDQRIRQRRQDSRHGAPPVENSQAGSYTPGLSRPPPLSPMTMG
ncbi:hypothetical protein QBC34DRAFT_475092 [Podospora aff. communis PSN243]|uniref:Nephrocystin 3-like N-terminal domain-containing protein n=1 Tax=Podospora aff. communis PSN243 TaxID=3040156 RepID=A0AAV9G710_9PEZI|nr:hypothetical protein QBC34DRAFT_475092 [Podospora aff. communis PSN243]